MLWVDKYRPHALTDLSYGKEQAAALAALAASKDVPHMLFYGPSGAGKHTRVRATLRAVYGAGVDRVRLEHRAFKTASGRSVEISLLCSMFHTEINPGDAGIYDRLVVQEVIKEMAQHNPLLGAGTTDVPWKVLVLTEVDRLTTEAQAALRRTMESYTATCRLVLIASSLSKVIDPLRSRCLCMRVPAPSQPEVMSVLSSIATAEGLDVHVSVLSRIAKQANNNLRRSILLLEAAKVSNPSLVAGTPVPALDWEKYIGLLVADVLLQQTPQQLLACRARLYELLVNCIPADVIIKRFMQQLLAGEAAATLPLTVKHQLMHWAAFYEHRLQCGQKELFHLEAFIAKAMTILKLASMSPTAAAAAMAGAGAGAGAAASAPGTFRR